MADSDITLTVDAKAGDVTSAASALQKQIKEMFNTSVGEQTSIKFQKLLMSLDGANTKMDPLLKKMEELGNQKIVPTEFKKLQDSIDKSEKSLKALEAQLTKTANEINSEKILQVSTPAFTKLNKDAKKLEEQIDATYGKIRKLEHLSGGSSENPTAAYKKLTGTKTYKGLFYDLKQFEEKLKEVNAEQKEMINNGTAYTNTARYKKLSAEHTRLAEKLAEELKNFTELNDEKAKYVNSGKPTAMTGLDTKEGEKVKNKLNSIVNATNLMIRSFEEGENKALSFGEIISNNFGNSFIAFANNIRQLPKMVEGTFDQIVTEATASMGPGGTFVQIIYSGIKLAVKLIINEFVTTAKQVTGVIKNTVTKALNVATTAAKNFAKALAKAASNTLLNPFKKLGDAIGGIGKKATESDFSMKKFGRAILQYGIGVRSLYRLINKLRTALFEGFADLALAYEPFNDSMSQIITALNYLKNSFAAAFAPIIEYVAPVLSIFVTKVAEAVQWIGQLIAALTGKEFVMALPVFKDYSEETKAGAAAAREQAQAEKQAKKAAEDEAKAEKKRNKALEKLQRTIAGFDDVELLKDNTSDDTDDNYGFDPDKYDFSTPTLDAALQTFKVGGPIQAGIKQFADLLKKAWETANAYDLGQLMSAKLGKLLKTFNENVPKIQEFTSRIARIVASFLAGFLSIPETFIQLGKAIGNAINIVFSTIQEFLRTFLNYDGFKNLGRDLFLVITNALKTINWDTIYDVFAMLGIGIAQILNETIAKPEFWISIFDALCNAVRTVAIQIIAFSRTLEWGDIGKAIADGIIYFFDNFPFDTVSEAIRTFLGGLWTAFINFVTEMDGHWYEIGSDIAKFIISLFEDFEPVEFAHGVISFLDGLWDAFMGFVETPGWDEVVDKVGTAIATFLNDFEWEEKANYLLEFLNNAITKLKELVDKLHIHELIDRLITWLRTNPEVKKLVNSIVDIIIKFTLLQIQVKIELFKLIGAKILTHIIGGLVDFIASGGLVGMAVNSLIKAITNAVNANKDGNINTGSEIGTAIDDGLSGETDTIASTAASIDASIQEKLSSDAYKSIMADNTKGANEALSDFRSEATGTVSTASEEMQTALASGDWDTVMRTYTGDANQALSDGSNDLVTQTNSLADNMTNSFASQDWNSIGNDVIAGIYNGLSGGWGWLCDTVWNLATDLLNSAKNALGIASPSKVFKEAVGKMIPAGIGVGIEANADSALGAVDDLSTGLVKTAKNIKIPPIAMGEVIPYNIANGQNDSTQATLKSLADMIQLQQREMVTNESLMRAIALIIDNMPDFYIGPEKLARIVKQGNTQLNRRYGY